MRHRGHLTNKAGRRMTKCYICGQPYEKLERMKGSGRGGDYLLCKKCNAIVEKQWQEVTA